MKSFFSGVVFVSCVLYAAWFFFPIAWPYLYEPETIDILKWSGYGSIINLSGPIPYLIGVAYLVATVGLLLFKNWGRVLFLMLTVVNAASMPLYGIGIQGPYESVIGNIVTVCDGVILAMCYLSSVSNEFQKGT